MQGVILAAGKGKRLQPLSHYMSKAMAPILGKPIIQWHIEDIIASTPIRDWVIVTSPENGDIVRHFHETLQDGKALGADVRVRYAEQTERLGTAHALRCARPLLEDDFLMTACDSLFPREHLAEIYKAHYALKANITLSLMKVTVDQYKETAIVAMNSDGEITYIIEKPTPEEAPSDMGSLPLYLFNKKALGYLEDLTITKRGEYEIQEPILRVINNDGGGRGVVTPWRHSLTSIDDFLEINLDFLARRLPADSGNEHKNGFARVTITPPVLIEEGAQIGAGSNIGPNVYIARDVRIGEHAQLSNTVALAGTTIPDNAAIDHRVLHPDIAI